MYCFGPIIKYFRPLKHPQKRFCKPRPKDPQRHNGKKMHNASDTQHI